MNDMDAYKDIFLSESAEFIQAITGGLLDLEESPHDLGPVEVIFRGAHSLKGMSATMGYESTADLTHKMEGLMDRVRKRARVVDTALIDLMLEAVDTVKALIAEESQGSVQTDVSGLVARLAAMAGADSAEPVDQDASEAADGVRTYAVTVTLEGGCVLKAVRAYMVMKRLSHMGTVIDTVPSAREIEDERFDRDFTVTVATMGTVADIEKAVTDVSEVEHATVDECTIAVAEEFGDERSAVTSRPSGRRTEIPKLSETQTVRIAMGHLDTMVDLVGELVILRSRLDRIARSVDSRELSDTVEELHRISAELQYEVMDTRMVPVGNIFNRFPRMVRDLAHDLGKNLTFRMEGLDIELDRTVLDEIGDPIVHLLRNSVDHGIEPPDQREAAGKPAKGTVTLAARRERDMVRISVCDDGNGMDVERVWDKACSLGMAHAADRDSYHDDDILLFTCAPGFSTTEQATRVSGRGVGMDAVKGKIEHLGGSLAIHSSEGVGTEVELSLPLTLAIIQALLVSTCGQTFALPLGSVDEVLDPNEATIDTIDGAPVLILRDGDVVPLLRLDTLLGLSDENTGMPSGDEHVVLVQYGAGVRRGLVVEGLQGRTEVVIKPLASLFRDVHGVSGATVLGDGRVALILDPRTIF